MLFSIVEKKFVNKLNRRERYMFGSDRLYDMTLTIVRLDMLDEPLSNNGNYIIETRLKASEVRNIKVF